MPIGLTNYAKLRCTAGFLDSRIVDHKLLGSASFVLGVIGMFLGVPAITIVAPEECLVEPRQTTSA